MGDALRVFISYSHKDEEFKDELVKALASLRREGAIETWHDRQIQPGANWEQTLDANLDRAELVVLLVSSDFIHSDDCDGTEMTRALERHERGEARVIPIIVRPCDWTRAPFSKLQGLPRDGKAITRWGNRDEAWLDVARGIRGVVSAVSPAMGAEHTASKMRTPTIGPRNVPRLNEETAALRSFEEGQPVVLMGPDRFGKSTLLRSLVERARRGEIGQAAVVELNLRDLGDSVRASVDDWMTSFAAYLAHARGGDTEKAANLRNHRLPWGVKLTDMVQRDLFPRSGELLVLAIDNADAAWGLPFQNDVFQILRSWCEMGSEQRSPWDRLRLLLAVSTTPALLKDGPTISPWNLAPPIELEDLSAEQVEAIALAQNGRCSAEEVRLLTGRIGGHPWLVSVVVKRWHTVGGSLERVIEAEEAGTGKLAEHLSALGRRLREDAKLVEAVCSILDDPRRHLDVHVFDRLRQAGVVQASVEGNRIRFPLYETYLRNRWRPSVMLRP